jgi:hypothetical protein
MREHVTISVHELIGGPSCVVSGDGQRLHDQIAEAIEHGNEVTLSFTNVTSLTAAFLNVAVGQLYGSFSPQTIRSRLHVTHLQPENVELLKRVVDNAKEYFVVDNAKEYFKDPKRFQDATHGGLRDDADGR